MQQDVNRKQTNSTAWWQRWRGWLLAVLLMSCVAVPGPVSAQPDFVVSIVDLHDVQSNWDLLIVAIRSGFFNYCVFEEVCSGQADLIQDYLCFLRNELTREKQEYYKNHVTNYGRRESYWDLFLALRDTGTRLVTVGDYYFAGTYQKIAALQGNVLMFMGGLHLATDRPSTGLEYLSPDGYALHARLGGVVMMTPGVIAGIERYSQIFQPYSEILYWLSKLPRFQRFSVDFLQFPGVEQSLLQALTMAKQNYQLAKQNQQLAMHSCQLAGLVAAIKPPAVSPPLQHPPSSLEVLGQIFLEIQEQRNQLAKIEATINPPASPCPYGCTVPLNNHDELVNHMARVHGKESGFLQFHSDRRNPGSGPWWAGGGPPRPGAGSSGQTF